MKASSSCIAVFAVVVLVVLAEVSVEAATCNPSELAPCAGSFSSGSPPSKECCNKLVEQKPCLCGYLKDPNLRQYVNSPNAKKISSTCGVPIPKC